MSAVPWIPFDFALLRVVPRPHLAEFANVGVIVHARTADFLGLELIDDPEVLSRCAPGVDAELLAAYLRTTRAICYGDAEAAGPLALLAPSERFHWLTAPRSDVLQSSPVHAGVCVDPAAELDHLFATSLTRFARPEAP